MRAYVRTLSSQALRASVFERASIWGAHALTCMCMAGACNWACGAYQRAYLKPRARARSFGA
eukprot:1911978-Alexandrium_andersonii.AAC.1